MDCSGTEIQHGQHEDEQASPVFWEAPPGEVKDAPKEKKTFESNSSRPPWVVQQEQSAAVEYVLSYRKSRGCTVRELRAMINDVSGERLSAEDGIRRLQDCGAIEQTNLLLSSGNSMVTLKPQFWFKHQELKDGTVEDLLTQAILHNEVERLLREAKAVDLRRASSGDYLWISLVDGDPAGEYRLVRTVRSSESQHDVAMSAAPNDDDAEEERVDYGATYGSLFTWTNQTSGAGFIQFENCRLRVDLPGGFAKGLTFTLIRADLKKDKLELLRDGAKVATAHIALALHGVYATAPRSAVASASEA